MIRNRFLEAGAVKARTALPADDGVVPGLKWVAAHLHCFVSPGWKS